METRTIPPPQASARQTEMGDKFNRVLFSALDALHDNQIPYALIGGIAASGMGRPRPTHDIDIFVRPEDAEAAIEALAGHGFETERTDARWLYKGWKDEMMVDIIFKSQGDIYFDTEMHERARLIPYHGRDIPAVAPEDLIIIKAAVHSEIGPHHWHDALAILSHSNMNWPYLIKRARRAPRRLLALLVYAQSNDIWIPNNVIAELFSVIFGQTQTQQEMRSQQTVFNSGSSGRSAQGTSTSQVKVSGAPSGGKPQPEIYLLGHIQESLATDSRTCTADIDLVIDQGKIQLRGEAQTPDLRRSIEQVVRDNATGFEIDNLVTITEMAEPEVGEVV